jgi:hypothetical protein
VVGPSRTPPIRLRVNQGNSAEPWGWPVSIHLHPQLAAYWLLVIIAKLALVVVVNNARRRNWFFTAFVSVWAMRSVVLFGCSYAGWAWAYTFVYWIGNGLLHGLAAATAYECFRELFSPVRRLPKTFAHLFISFTVLITAAALILAVLYPAVVSATELSATQNTIDRTLAIWICGLFWVLNFASDWLHIPWRRKLFGVGLGFLFSYSIDLFITTVRAFTPWQIAHYQWPIGFTVDLICCSVWIFYITRKEPDLVEPDPNELESLLSLIRRPVPLQRLSHK